MKGAMASTKSLDQSKLVIKSVKVKGDKADVESTMTLAGCTLWTKWARWAAKRALFT